MPKSLKKYKKENKKYCGDKILLVPMGEIHVGQCIKWLADADVNKYLSNSIKNVTQEQELEWLEFIKESENDIVFAILDKSTNCYIGNCGLHKIDKRKKTCEFGIFIGDKKYWNRGFGTDTVKTILYFAVNELEIFTVRLTV
ncbi:MAG: GNAT family N-acetyltransferase, partial [Actinobacteria bacterium]|nr:GNAT family N-acetyltransferase [Actinomycetota bacterium]